MTIRRQPTDFRVQERLDDAFARQIAAAPAPTHPCALYQLHKTSLTTPQTVAYLAKALPFKAPVEYAGLKDKHAHTTQHVTVTISTPRQAAHLPATIAAPDGSWTASRTGWVPAPITAKAIGANHFTIVVRDLSEQAAAEMVRRADRLSLPGPGGVGPLFTNYFGDQRFGSARHGQGWAAVPLVAGDFIAALKLVIATPARKDVGKTRTFTRLAATHWGEWKRLAAELPLTPEKRAVDALAAGLTPAQAFAALPAFTQMMVVEAFQSHLWNRTAASLLAAHAPSPADLLTTPDDFGDMVSLAAAAIPPALRTLNLPCLAPGVDLVPPWAEHAAAALAAHGLATKDLRIPGLRRPFFGKSERPLIVAASAFALSPPQPDDLTPKRLKVTVDFSLPRGSYATVLLRALGQ